MTRRSSRLRPTWPLVLSGVCLLVGMAGVAHGEPIQIVVPNDCANAEAADSGGVLTSRNQLIYAADQFADLPAGGGYLISIRSRPDGASSYSGPLFFDELTVSASVTNVAPGEMGLSFEENYRGPFAVLRRAVVRATAPWWGHTDNIGPPGGPKAFDIEFILDTPYRYVPAEGNLVLDIVVLTPLWPIRIDRLADYDKSELALAYALDANSATAEAVVGGHVMEFTLIPIYLPGDLDGDDDVDWADLVIFEACSTGPAIPYAPAAPPTGCTAAQLIRADFDRDNDVDQADFSAFQRCYGSTGNPADLDCAG